MGTSEGDKPIKSEKPTSPPQNFQEQINVHVYPDWAAVQVGKLLVFLAEYCAAWKFQAYYGAGAIPPPYFNPAVASGHAAHPYMWAPPQMIPPYGSPYAAIYPHAGIYGHSATPVVATPLTLEPPGGSANDSGSGKKPKEADVHPAAGNGNSNSNGNSECPRDGGVHGQSQSTDCGTEGSCDRSDNSTAREDNNRSNNGVSHSGIEAGIHASPSVLRKLGTYNGHMLPYPTIDANTGNGIVQGIPLASLKPVGSTPTPAPQMNHSSSVNANAINMTAPCAPRHAGVGVQDDRELKREKRKQSNRESARRSRLRKQAEMQELGRKVHSLTVENMALRSEINKLMEDSEKLRSENAALMEKLNNNKQSKQLKRACKKISKQENSLMNTENLLSRVNNSIANEDHERGIGEK
ncbi:hypothetical protein Cgig2_005068 [Carnegiea gigantea]|uniref:BZIP domain-containing protein n=1 Tax=Carnegiea gigantea TaxID=171969 RepID=A0A9Q1L278_9CARY|nr:hypothetical protein Cgig2_005068 [Carnegiea gigantea]